LGKEVTSKCCNVPNPVEHGRANSTLHEASRRSTLTTLGQHGQGCGAHVPCRRRGGRLGANTRGAVHDEAAAASAARPCRGAGFSLPWLRVAGSGARVSSLLSTAVRASFPVPGSCFAWRSRRVGSPARVGHSGRPRGPGHAGPVPRSHVSHDGKRSACPPRLRTPSSNAPRSHAFCGVNPPHRAI
jgi:hypothetical protein